ANPIAAILTGALLLDHIGEKDAAATVENAVRSYLEEAKQKELPVEFGGEALTGSVGQAVLQII
ncbi:MAG: isocitrate/isopropylmalate family dehydrogenase, partial [Synergistaceae bacterium]|nr:isocitrate/isopropylmalate family dehydrogenase [Synergistaceae bacterium]